MALRANILAMLGNLNGRAFLLKKHNCIPGDILVKNNPNTHF
jgi:hypothetical protein